MIGWMNMSNVLVYVEDELEIKDVLMNGKSGWLDEWIWVIFCYICGGWIRNKICVDEWKMWMFRWTCWGWIRNKKMFL